jgi:hypothetical protein
MIMANKGELTQLAIGLLKKTREDKLRWDGSVSAKLYFTNIRHKFFVTLQREMSIDNLSHAFRIMLWDNNKDNLIANFSANELEEPSLLHNLCEAIEEQFRRNDRRMQKKLEKMIKTLRNL